MGQVPWNHMDGVLIMSKMLMASFVANNWIG